ncbi:alpha/beta fold hydrolase [Lentibacter sp. XHP0401]|jgi:non-heme chloroperoxidase|uniref:alpha/beta fold hydrolase n=1 Tax=Lentibacter sp. XHP0401 TaxID=2984334 RepID=UPI0021E97948|nr:alpha/beta hydrolase [Lentibacter sp. XHP0401]MCV2893403.1 alpha/beta hydrolase [Lentibacter sp. XHP0401]
MREHTVTGGGGLKLHVTDQGPENAPALLLIHGWAQHSVAWAAQAPLTERFRVVALDLRGHGSSDAPQDVSAYTETQLWGDDIHAVITELGLKSTVLVGWSYGARVIASYIATHGQDAIAGVVLVGGVIAIGEAREPWMMGAGSPALNKDLYTSNQARLLAATAQFVDQCTYAPLPRETYGVLVGANMFVSPLVRRALFAGTLDCRPVWKGFTRPALVIHGTNDAIVEPLVGQTAAETLSGGTLSLWPETGHAPFAEHPERFNEELATFATQAIEESA